MDLWKQRPCPQRQKKCRFGPFDTTLTADHKVYLRIPAYFVRPEQPLTFDLFRQQDANRLKMVVDKNQLPRFNLKKVLSQLGKGDGLYIHAEDKDQLLDYEENAIETLLNDEAVPLDQKCQALQSLTTALSVRLFEDPCARNIARHRKTIFRVVDFAINDTHALKALMQVTHHDYYTYTHSVNVGLYALLIAATYFGTHSQHNLHEIVTRGISPRPRQVQDRAGNSK